MSYKEQNKKRKQGTDDRCLKCEAIQMYSAPIMLLVRK